MKLRLKNPRTILMILFVCQGLSLPGTTAQGQGVQEPSLGEIARQLREQKEQKKEASKVARVWTNDNLPTQGAARAPGQEIAPQSEIKPAPLLTGWASFVTNFRPGDHLQMATTVSPILLLPLGRRLLIEAEFELEGEFEREADTGKWGRTLARGVEYAQLDYIVSRHVTLVIGRFLNPFGIFNERLHPSWIKKLQTTPLIFPIGTDSSNGAMLRGGFSLGSRAKLNYAAYFSAPTSRDFVQAKRAAGGRWGLVFPNRRLEIGTSFQRLLQDELFNSYGFDATWQPMRRPLEFRGEYARSMMGSGYWVEGAYRFFRKYEVVARGEQFFAMAGSADASTMPDAGGHGELPTVNTRRLLLGWNYYFRSGLKFSFSYGREFTADGGSNIWSGGLSYRLFK